MRHLMRFSFLALCIVGICLTGCGNSGGGTSGGDGGQPGTTTQFNGPGLGLPTGGIAGRVLNSNTMTGVPGALVTINLVRQTGLRSEALEQNAAGQTLTDANGDFILNGLPAGVYDVVVTATGFTSRIRPNVTVTTGAVSTIEGTELQIEPTTDTTRGTVTGVFLNEFTRQPFVGARVELRNSPGPLTGNPVAAVTVNQTGSFQFTNVIPGTYVLTSIAATGQPALASRTSAVITVTAGGEVLVEYLNIVSLGQGWIVIVDFSTVARDYDSHFWTPPGAPSFHGLFSRRGSATACPFVLLNDDDTDGVGREIVQFVDPDLANPAVGPVVGTYQFGVDDFSNAGNFLTDRVFIEVFNDAGRVARIEAPAGAGDFWDAIDLIWDGTTLTVTPRGGPQGVIVAEQTNAQPYADINGCP